MAPYLNWNMNTRLDRFLLNQLQLWPASIHRGQLFARLLVAELRGTPWPIDDFDPLHQRLRPILRDGEIMGAYSVGNDGIDDGGEKDDRYFPLYGPRTAPKATP